jgi:hypothetical protein
MDEIFSNNQSSKVTPTPSNNNSEFYSQIDFISSNNNNQSNNYNVNNNSSLINNFNNSYPNVMINQQTNLGNNMMNFSQNSNQFSPFADFNNLNNSATPQNVWNNQSSSFSELIVNPNNKQTVIMFDNKSDFTQQQSISNNNFNESEIKTANSVTSENELKKKLMNNSKLVDINNLFGIFILKKTIISKR